MRSKSRTLEAKLTGDKMSNPTAAKPARSINPKHNRKRSKKGRGALIAIIISVVLIGAFAALLFLNIYNIRDMMFDRIAGVPLIGALVPESEGGERVPRVSASDLQSRIDLLQRQLDSATRDRDNLRVENEGLKRENERLTGFEEWQEQFKLDMETFATGLITDDPMAFWQIVLQMDPDLVTELAREASGDAQRAKEVRDYIRMISDMDLKSAISPSSSSKFALYIRKVAGSWSTAYWRISLTRESLTWSISLLSATSSRRSARIVSEREFRKP